MSLEKNKALHGVVLAGGSGTRLWPLSTAACPKQFLSLFSEQSLLQETLQRLGALDASWIVAGQDHGELLSQHLPDFKQEHLLLEPQAKNTAAALVWAAYQISQQDPEAVMAVFPADHYIPPQDQGLLEQNLNSAAALAQQEAALVTFGIRPDHPATGYGYLEVDTPSEAPVLLKSFHEKPDLSTAQKYLAQGNYYWNSGIFVWRAKVFLEIFKKNNPKEAVLFEQWQAGALTLEALYQALPAISVDYAVLEKAPQVWMVPASFTWSDVGGFQALAALLDKDEDGNAGQGRLGLLKASNNLILNKTNKPVVLFGAQDLVVVQSSSATLVMPKDQIKNFADLKKYLSEQKLI